MRLALHILMLVVVVLVAHITIHSSIKKRGSKKVSSSLGLVLKFKTMYSLMQILIERVYKL